MKRSSTCTRRRDGDCCTNKPRPARRFGRSECRERGRFRSEHAFRCSKCRERAYRRQSGQGLIDREEWKAERKLSAWHHGDRSR